MAGYAFTRKEDERACRAHNDALPAKDRYKRAKYAGYVDLNEINALVCKAFGAPVDPKRNHVYFELITDFGWYALFNLGGSHIEHYHWATYIEPRLERHIASSKTPEEYKDWLVLKYVAKRILLDDFIFVGFG